MHEPVPFHGKFIPREHLHEIGGELLEEIELGENKEANEWLKTLKHTENRSIITTHRSRSTLKELNGQMMNWMQATTFRLHHTKKTMDANNQVLDENDHRQVGITRRRKRFTEEETARLIAGVEAFWEGLGKDQTALLL